MKVSQTQKLFSLLSDGQAHRTDAIVRFVYPSSNYCSHCGRGDMKSLARVGARVDDLKNGKWRGKTHCLIRGWHDEKNRALYWYQMDYPKDFRLGMVNVADRPITLPPAFEPKSVKIQQRLV